MTYEDSVLHYADDYGNLTLSVAKQLFKEHGSDYWKAHEEEGFPITLNAEKILNWLGY